MQPPKKKRVKTAILCRTNAPMLKMARDLSRRCPGIKFLFIGRDIAKALKDRTIEILEWRRNVKIAEFRVLMEGWISEMRNKYKDAEGKESVWAAAEDSYEQLELLSSDSKVTNSSDLMEKIDKTFVDADDLDDDPDVIVFASGHRCKGLEWQRAIVVRFDLMPHPNADTEEDMRQEEHIIVVATTRGKEELIVCHDPRPDPKPERR